jgi:outer membrane protein OmpA-like peptidoglycan-associated protein
VLASVDYVSRADTDTDGDGIIDKVDACVTIPGVASPDPKKHGCPSDRDKDGILDRDDACVEVPGVAHSDPKKNGCPSDRDNDGILDGDDACPDILGVKSAIAALNGCPVDEDKSSLVPLDRDRDTVLDDADKCPDQPGLTQAPASVGAAQRAKWEEQFLGCPEDIDNDKIANLPDACPRHPGAANKDPQKHGCPMVVPDGCQIKLLERVFFKTQSEVLESAGAKGKTTQAVLQAMLELLRTSPQLTHIEVQGHASQDAYAKNQELSEKRAMSVVTWLTERGIDPSRLVPKGYGTSAPAKDVPVDRKNKELHQRVEFHIVGCDKTKAR